MKTLLAFLLMIPFGIFAQVGINTTTPNAQLDIRSANQAAPSNTDGLLIPKIDTFPAVNPTASQQGMLVYLTTTAGSNAPGFYYWDNVSAAWTPVGGKTGWATNGNSGTADGTNFIGTTDNKPLNFKVNNDKAGRIDITLENTFFGYQTGKNTTGNLNTAIGNRAFVANINGVGNTALGRLSLNANTSANYSTAIGLEAMEFGTTGSFNTAVGWRSLRQNLSGTENTAIGVGAIENGAISSRNVAVGRGAMINAGTSSNNVAIGNYTLQNQSFTNGGVSYNSNNIAIGHVALFNNNPTTTSNGIQNVAIGTQSLYANTIGARNTAVGSLSLLANTTGGNNSAFGPLALGGNTLGSDNIGVGLSAAQGNTTAGSNIAIGTNSLRTQSYNNGGAAWSSLNMAIGYNALFANQPTSVNNGIYNTGIGNYALSSNTTGRDNVALGLSSLFSNSTGNQNAAFGNYAGYYALGSQNTFAGHFAGIGNNGGAIGNRNTALGWYSFYSATTGSQNTALGDMALYNNTSGFMNVGVGSSALDSYTTGSYNAGIGANAGRSSGSFFSGNFNFYGGYNSGNINILGSYNTFLGANANVTNTGFSYATAIGADAFVNCNNCMALGGITPTTRTNVGINTHSPGFAMEINEKNDGTTYGIGLGLRFASRTWEISHAANNNLWFSYDGMLSAYISNVGGTYNVSDRRLKKDIVPLENVLDKVMQLKPSHYRFIKNDGKLSIGFIAQEVLPLFPEVVSHQEITDPKSEMKDIYAVDYANLSAVAIKAIQEQQQQIEQLETALEKEKRQNADLSNRLGQFEQRLKKLEQNH